MKCPACQKLMRKRIARGGGEYYRCASCKKSVDADSVATAIAEDAIVDVAGENEKQARPVKGKSGPKKVLDQSAKEIADGLASVLSQATGAPHPKGLSYQEAQSITNPVIRQVKKRLPAVVADNLPGGSMDPDDFADLVEVALTLGKFFLRRLFIWFYERQAAKHARQKPASAHQPAADSFQEQEVSPQTQEQQNGHAVPVGAFYQDIGQEV